MDYQDNFEDFFENTLCGYAIADSKGILVRVNTKLATWLDSSVATLKGKPVTDMLSIGSKIYYETHLHPLLQMQGYFEEIVVELSPAESKKLRVLINAMQRSDENGNPLFIRYTIVKATDRLLYEQNLQSARTKAEAGLLEQTAIVSLRDQLIAVLGHDLRNPLSAITMGISLLSDNPRPEDADIIATLQRSAARMAELIKNIMDFARTRLGQEIILNMKEIKVQPFLLQVISELRLIHPKAEINIQFEADQSLRCDPDRLGQLLSNLIGNAVTHGAAGTPVSIQVKYNDQYFELSVTNSGEPIPEQLRQQLFTPFAREEGRASHNGLGLGLYIAAEIAKAHHADLTFTSTASATTFTLRMPLS